MPRIAESPPQPRPPGDVALELSSVLHFTLLVAPGESWNTGNGVAHVAHQEPTGEIRRKEPKPASATVRVGNRQCTLAPELGRSDWLPQDGILRIRWNAGVLKAGCVFQKPTRPAFVIAFWTQILIQFPNPHSAGRPRPTAKRT